MGDFKLFYLCRLPWGLEIWRLVNSEANRIFLIPFKVLYIYLGTYLWDVHSSKNNSKVPRSGELYEVEKKFPSHILLLFLTLRAEIFAEFIFSILILIAKISSAKLTKYWTIVWICSAKFDDLSTLKNRLH